MIFVSIKTNFVVIIGIKMSKSRKIRNFFKKRNRLSSTIVDEEKVMNTITESIAVENSTVIPKQ